MVINDNPNIGKYILVSEMGLGQVVQTVEMGGRGKFYRVEFEESKSSNYFSIDNPTGYRFVDTKEKLEAAIAIFKQKRTSPMFKSNREKIEFYKKALKTNDIVELAKHMAVLNSEEEIHPSLTKVFDSAVKTLVLELEFVYECRNIEAWRMLGLTKNNK
ncbi:MAG: hypothetical protein CME65_08180 [Halobacteriovoraceae bacterium]|nr:hypothetical protein [Halobacteriovoraceae bacterium]|tara:strand:+ start:4162 stop:4638 length:477 start_codon:yes stop_codon:yes gene_type:complete